MKDPVNGILNLILSECQSILSESHEISKKFDSGTPPRKAIVKYHDQFNKNGFEIGNTINEWTISQDEIKENKSFNKEERHIHSSVEGNYYTTGKFYFSIDDAFKQIVLEYFLGPQYATGLFYTIIVDNEQIIVQDKKMLWIS